MGYGVLSKLSVATSIFDHGVKEFLMKMFGVDTVVAAGSTQADGAQITAGRVVVTSADGTKGVVLPPAIDGAKVEIVNTVSNQTLKVYAAVGEQINAITTTSAFSLVGGARGVFYADVNQHWYVAAANLTGTSTSSSTAELDTLAGVTGGTVTASKAVVVNSAKAVDTLRATGDLNVGGTGVPGAAAVMTTITKAITAFTDTTAKDVFTVTVPNAAHAARIEVCCLGVMGAGGAIGAGESSMSSKYIVTLARTAGVACVAGVSTAVGTANAKVAGANDLTSVVVTTSAMTGAVGATQTFTIKVAITKAAGAGDNHTGVFTARLLNQNATGVTIA